MGSSKFNLKLVMVQMLEQIRRVEAPEAQMFESIDSNQYESNRWGSNRIDSTLHKFDSMESWGGETVRIHGLCITSNRSILSTFESIGILLLRIDRIDLSKPSVRNFVSIRTTYPWINSKYYFLHRFVLLNPASIRNLASSIDSGYLTPNQCE